MLYWYRDQCFQIITKKNDFDERTQLETYCICMANVRIYQTLHKNCFEYIPHSLFVAETTLDSSIIFLLHGSTLNKNKIIREIS